MLTPLATPGRVRHFDALSAAGCSRARPAGGFAGSLCLSAFVGVTFVSVANDHSGEDDIAARSSLRADIHAGDHHSKF